MFVHGRGGHVLDQRCGAGAEQRHATHAYRGGEDAMDTAAPGSWPAHTDSRRRAPSRGCRVPNVGRQQAPQPQSQRRSTVQSFKLWMMAQLRSELRARATAGRRGRWIVHTLRGATRMHSCVAFAGCISHGAASLAHAQAAQHAREQPGWPVRCGAHRGVSQLAAAGRAGEDCTPARQLTCASPAAWSLLAEHMACD